MDTQRESGKEVKKCNCPIDRLYRMSLPLLLAFMSKKRIYVNDNERRKEAIQSFFADKICTKPKEVLARFEEQFPWLMYKSFRNHIYDLMRRQKARDKKHASHLQIVGGTMSKEEHYDESEKMRRRFRRIILERHNEKYVKIFDLMAEEWTNKEIAIELNENTNAINVAVCRIRKTLKEVC
ncbi:MAG: hypothetical protein AAGG75_02820 [Bacteroidota bacterium]